MVQKWWDCSEFHIRKLGWSILLFTSNNVTRITFVFFFLFLVISWFYPPFLLVFEYDFFSFIPSFSLHLISIPSWTDYLCKKKKKKNYFIFFCVYHFVLISTGSIIISCMGEQLQELDLHLVVENWASCPTKNIILWGLWRLLFFFFFALTYH